MKLWNRNLLVMLDERRVSSAHSASLGIDIAVKTLFIKYSLN